MSKSNSTPFVFDDPYNPHFFEAAQTNDGTGDKSWYVNEYYPDSEGHMRRDTIAYNLTKRQAEQLAHTGNKYADLLKAAQSKGG